MKIRIILSGLLILLGIFIILTAIAFYKPDWFQDWLQFSPEFVNKTLSLYTAILAFSTLLLAYAAVDTIRNSNEQENRRRIEELAREKRDKNERLLNEIIKWAEDIINCGAEPIPEQSLVVNIESNEQRMNADNWLLTIIRNDTSRYSSLLTKKTYFARTTNIVGDSLAEPVSNTINELNEHLRLLELFDQEYGELGSLDTSIRNRQRRNFLSIGQHKTRLNQIANKLIDETSKIKVGNIS